MNKCVLRAVQAAMTNTMLDAVKAVSRARCVLNTLPPPLAPDIFALLRLRWRRSRLVAEVQKMGPAQLEMRVRKPTATTLNDEIPLYAEDRSTEEMAFEPPKAKKLAYWSRIEEMVIWTVDRSRDCRQWWRMMERRKRGMFVARDWVMARRV